MDDLTAFVTARLDEDEAAAEAVRPDQDYADSEHQERWNPARVLREVEAKRRILTEVKAQIDGMDAQINQDRGPDHYYTPTGESDLLLKLLALPYSGHPEYRQEWKP